MATGLPTEAIDTMPVELLAGIGEVVARWGYLQFQLGVIIREACRVDRQTGTLLTQGPTIQSLCASITAIADSEHWLKDAELRADLRKLATRVRNAKDVRNEYAHGVFGFGGTEGVFARYVFDKKGGPMVPEPITVEGLKRDALKPRELWEEAQRITRRLKALRQKPR